VHFGYYYRNYYEKQLRKKDSIEVHAFIFPPNQLLSWIPLSALGGIIGGTSFEISKVILGKIISQFKKLQEDNLPGNQIFEDRESIARFLSCLGDYYHGLTNIDEEVRNAIIHEMIVHESEKILEEEPSLKFPEATEYLHNKAKNRVRDKITSRISEEEWNAIWNNVDMSA